MGCLLATAMFAAPIADLRTCLLRKSLGDLNPRPWAVMTGNCLGWCAYAYYIHDPFILASNIPGLILSMWLNAGAAKLQYRQMTTFPSGNHPGHRPTTLLHVQTNEQDAQDAQDVNDKYTEPGDIDEDMDDSQLYYNTQSHPLPPPPVFTPQEVWWLRVMMIWGLILAWVRWISPFPGYEAATVGLLVNVNLIFFYGVPLQTMSEVVRNGQSNSIHPPSMFTAIGNSTFWLLYGVALWDPVLMVPNSIGLALGLCQVVLCLIYPKRPRSLLNGHRHGRHNRSLSLSGTNHISLTVLPPLAAAQASPGGLFRDLQLASRFEGTPVDLDSSLDDER